MSTYKSPGEDGIFPALLQKHILHIICQIYRASIACCYTATAWRVARVTFLLKPGKSDYTGPKSFRPISLTSFLLKGLEKLVDISKGWSNGSSANASQTACLPSRKIHGRGSYVLSLWRRIWYQSTPSWEMQCNEENSSENINYCVRGGHKPARWPWPTSPMPYTF